MRMKKCVLLEFILWVGFLIAFFLLLSIPVHGATVQAHFNKTYVNANGTTTEIQLNNLINVSDASVTFTVSGGGIFDNANGGTWQEYMSFPITTVPSEYAQYKIVINGNTWSIYNASGSLKATGTNDNFWSLVKSDGSDIRVFNQSSQLYFWIESWDYANQTAVIWVNLSAGSTELNIAYGNQYATISSYNNATLTLEFYDDFDDGVVDSVYVPVQGTETVSETNGVLDIVTGSNTAPQGVYINKQFPNDIVVEVDVLEVSTSTANKQFGVYVRYVDVNNFYIVRWVDDDAPPTRYKSILLRSAGTYTDLVTADSGVDASSGVWYHFKVQVSGSTFNANIAGTSLSVTDSTITSGYVGLYVGWDAGFEFKFDNLRIYKLADPASFGTPSVKSFKCVNPTLNLNGNLVQYAGELNKTNPCVTLSIDPSYFVNGINYANFTSDSGNFNAILSFDYALDIPESTTKTFEDMWVNASFYLPDGTITSNTTFEFNTSYLGTPVYSYNLIVYVNGQQYSNYKVSDYEVNGVKYITVHVLDVPAGNVSIAIHTVFKQTNITVYVYDELTKTEVSGIGTLDITLLDPNFNVLKTAQLNTSVSGNLTLHVVYTGYAYLRVKDVNGITRQILIYIPLTNDTTAYVYFPTSNIILVTFNIVDYTNSFKQGDVIIKKFIDRDKLVEIDRQKLTAEQKTSHYLIANEPYEVYITNGEETRSLGYLSLPTSDVITLIVKSPLNFTPVNYNAVIYNMTNDNGVITVQYKTIEGTTSKAEITIYNSTGAIVYYATSDTPNGKFTFVGNPNETYTVHFKVYNDFEPLEFKVTTSSGNFLSIQVNVQNIKELPEWFRIIFFGGLCLFVALLFKRSHVPVGLMLSFSLAAVFTSMGILPLGQGLLWVLAVLVGLSFFVWWRERER